MVNFVKAWIQVIWHVAVLLTECGTANHLEFPILKKIPIYTCPIELSLGIKKGDAVSLYVDMDSVCLRGALPPYTFKSLHLGNGVAKYSRQEVYSENAQLR